MCGACRYCVPHLYKRGIYIGDLEEDEVEALEDLWDR
jgi:hypothetical protein